MVVLLLAFASLHLFLLGPANEWAPWLQSWYLGAVLVCGAACCAALRIVVLRGWRNAFPAVMGVVVVYVLGLAMVGYAPCLGGRVPFLTQIYYGLLLLIGDTPPVIGAGITDAGGNLLAECAAAPLILQLAQFAGIAVLFGTVLRLLGSLASNRVTRRLTAASGKVIMIWGLNKDSLPVVRAIAASPDGALVVLVEPDPEHPLLPQVRRLGVHVVEGDLSRRDGDRRWLNGLVRGRHLYAFDLTDPDGRRLPWYDKRRVWVPTLALRRAYLLGEDDTANIAGAELIRQTIADLPPAYRHEYLPPPRVIVRVDRYLQGRHYAAEQVSDWGETSAPRVFISSIGRAQVTAQALVQQIMERGLPDRLLVVGSNDLRDAVLAEWSLQKQVAGLLADTSLACLRDDAKTEQLLQALQRRQFHQLKHAQPDPDRRASTPSVEELRRLMARHGRVTVLLTEVPASRTLADLERVASSLDPDRIRLFVASDSVQGIAEYPVLGTLHFYGLSLGGFDPADVRRQQVASEGAGRHFSPFWAPSPLFLVPQDSWYRAARLVSDMYSGDPAAWDAQDPTSRESNFRALWSTLTYLTDPGCDADGHPLLRHTWVSAPPRSYDPPSDEFLENFVPREHTNWLRFKCLGGVVGVAKDPREACLENRYAFPWPALQEPPLLENRKGAARNTLESLRYNICALEALDFYAVPEQSSS